MKHNRRNFLGVIFGALASAAAAQKTAIEGSQAVVCKENAVKCPNGHQTCPTINMPIAIGNDSYSYEEVHQLRDFHLIRCDVCHVLFTRE